MKRRHAPVRAATKAIRSCPEDSLVYDVSPKLTDPRFATPESIVEKFALGHDLTLAHLIRDGFRKPLLVEQPDGLEMRMPWPNFTVSDVEAHLGSSRILDVMNVHTQRGEQMSLADFVQYYNLPAAQRRRLLNVLSLEISHSTLSELVSAPALVQKIDWNDLAWPPILRALQDDQTNDIRKMRYPKVQKYCLMSVAGCYTDFHIDFGGTSVWYHILRGEKIFWLIPPTDANLILFQEWTLAGQQNHCFLGDLVSECYRIHLKSQTTFFIPSGWIHAVFTPKDSLVFGGNFLHSYAIPMQLNTFEVESNTRVPSKFRFPQFIHLLWYVVERYVHAISNVHFMDESLQVNAVRVIPFPLSFLQVKWHHSVAMNANDTQAFCRHARFTLFC